MTAETGKNRHLGLLIVLAFVIVVPIVLIAAVVARDAVRRSQCAYKVNQIRMALDEYERKHSDYPNATKLAFDTYEGYFVSSTFEPNAAESFMVIHDQEQFDKVFGVWEVSRLADKPSLLPKEAFRSSMVLAAIKRGKLDWTYRVERIVTGATGIVEFRYTATSKKREYGHTACPLIIAIPNGKYTAVQFVENGNVVKTVNIVEK